MTHTPEELAMARRIAASWFQQPAHWANETLAQMIKGGECDHLLCVQIALLAVQATTEAAAAWLERQELPGLGIESVDEHIAAIPDDLSAELRDRAHLKGNPHDDSI